MHFRLMYFNINSQYFHSDRNNRAVRYLRYYVSVRCPLLDLCLLAVMEALCSIALEQSIESLWQRPRWRVVLLEWAVHLGPCHCFCFLCSHCFYSFKNVPRIILNCWKRWFLLSDKPIKCVWHQATKTFRILCLSYIWEKIHYSSSYCF